MTREIEVSIAGTIVAVGTYDYCAEALGYAPSTLISYAAGRGESNTPLRVKRLPPMYRFDGEEAILTEDEARRRMGWSRRELQRKAAIESYRHVHRAWHGNWALPLDEVERLKIRGRKGLV